MRVERKRGSKAAMTADARVETIHGLGAIKKVIGIPGDGPALYALQKGYVPGAKLVDGVWMLDIEAYRNAR